MGEIDITVELKRKAPMFIKWLENIPDEDIINFCESFGEYQKKYSEKNKNEQTTEKEKIEEKDSP